MHDSLASFLAVWFGYAPYKISDFIEARDNFKDTPLSKTGWLRKEHYGVTRQELFKWRKDMEAILASCKQNQERTKVDTKFLASSGNRNHGFRCKIDNVTDADEALSLSGMLRRYLQMKVRDHGFSEVCALNTLREKRTGTQIQFNLLGVLGTQDFAFCHLFLNNRPCRLAQFMSSISGIMLQLENTGHEEVNFVDGLNVELLEFQRQTLKWALERETIPGGIQRLVWAPLPEDSTRQKDLANAECQTPYFSPILSRFRKTAPKVVRGGFIAEEMGLGKTVISLALILKNPAPSLPASGSPTSDLAKLPADSPWDKTTYNRSEFKRGSILSRGTLVIVSIEILHETVFFGF